jgi:hypothetical protein
MISLEEFTSELLVRLPVAEETNLTLNPQNCPPPPAQMETAQIKILKRLHDYNNIVLYDLIDFFADRPTYRALGLLVFSAVFHPNSRIVLHLRHRESEITQLIVECPVPNAADPGVGELVLIPAAYGYWPSIPDAHPLYYGNWSRWGRPMTLEYLPQLILTNEDGGCVTDEQRAARDVVEGFGDARGSATLAALLLDIGLPDTQRTEFCLEGPAGYQSLVPISAECRFWVGYDYTY